MSPSGSSSSTCASSERRATRALIAQLAPAPGNVDANVRRVEELLGGEGRSADLAVLPELFLSGYACVDDGIVDLDGPALRRVRRAAAKSGTAAILGLAERGPGRRVSNAAACVDADGALAAVHRKTHLFGAAERSATTCTRASSRSSSS